MLARFPLDSLLDELLLEIAHHLTPEDIARLKSVNRHLARVYAEQMLWQYKLLIHFPHIANQLAPGMTHDYQKLFIDSYASGYSNWYGYIKRMFSVIKEGHVVELQEQRAWNLGDIEHFAKNKLDDAGHSAIDWAYINKRQNILDYFHSIAQDYFSPRTENGSIQNIRYISELLLSLATTPATTTEYLPGSRQSALYWSLVFNQPVGQPLREQYSLEGPEGEEHELEPIHVAAQYGRCEVIREWVNAQPELLDSTDADDHTPLYWAIERKQSNAACLLVELGAETSSSTYSAIRHAIDKGLSGVVRAIYTKHPKLLNQIFGRQSLSPLGHALFKRRSNIAIMLIEANAELTPGDGSTLGSCAARYGMIDVIRKLIAIDSLFHADAALDGALDGKQLTLLFYS